MATFNKFYCFSKDVFEKKHDCSADVFKVALTNTAPTTADTVWSLGVYPAPAAALGYTAGGNTITITSSTQTTGTYKWVLADSTFLAAGGSIGPFRYAVIYNSSSANRVVGYIDYGSSLTLADTETLLVDFDAAAGVLTAA